MAYSEEDVTRIGRILGEKGVDFAEKRMFGGICFMVDNKMCLGSNIDTKSGESLLMCRIGEDEYEAALELTCCIPMTFTGKPMKGYVYVTPEGCKDDQSLGYWIQLCLDFNPKAKAGKRK